MDEKDFEKKSTKKVGKIIGIVLLTLIIIAVVGGYVYLKLTRKPEKIFSKAIEATVLEDKRKEKIQATFSASVDSDNEKIKQMNAYLGLIQIKTTTEIDRDKKIANENVVLSALGSKIIDFDAIIQNKKMYWYSKDLFSKYIQIPEERDEFNIIKAMYSELFKDSNNTIEYKKLENDIKQILKDEIRKANFSQEKTNINGKTALKTTLRTTEKEFLETTNRVLNKVYEYSKDENTKLLIENFETIIEEEDFFEGYIDIAIYTQGLRNNIVQIDIVLSNTKEDELIAIKANSTSKNKYEIKVLYNESSNNINGAKEMATIIIHKENENEWNVKIKLNIEEGYTIILKIDIKEEKNPTIEERKISNSVNVDELTEQDYYEIFENVKNNEILYSLIQTIEGEEIQI